MLETAHLVSKLSLDDLLTDNPEDYPLEFTQQEPEKILNGETQIDTVNLVILDVATCPDREQLLLKLERRFEPVTIALVRSGTIGRIQELKEFYVKIFLKRPLSPNALRKAMGAVRNDRNYMDPALSDSLVEHFLK